MVDVSRGCVLDTNVLIYHLHDVLAEETKSLLASALEARAVVSLITRIEVLCWPQHTDSLAATSPRRANGTPARRSRCRPHDELRQKTPLKLADAVIAATALELNLPLMTRNTRDFARVVGLELVEASATS
jgi:predicted nucleic acid-binding protein